MEYKEFTLKEAENAGFNQDSVETFWNDDIEGGEKKLIETTASYLSSINCGMFCGGSTGTEWNKVAQKYPDLKVRCFLVFGKWFRYGEMWRTGSVDIFVGSKKQSKDIENLSGLRCDFNKTGWTYFEDE